jgi:hypothetical protein
MAPNADDREEVRERLIERLDQFTPEIQAKAHAPKTISTTP